jgi:hypothetical protein
MLWNAAQEADSACYVSGPDYLEIDAGESTIKVSVRTRKPGRYSPRSYVVAVWVETDSGRNRVARLEPDEVSFHTGKHGIQWGDRWKDEDVERVIEHAFQAALEDASSLLSKDTKVYNA